MAFIHQLRPSNGTFHKPTLGQARTHSSYRDPDGGRSASCRLVGDDDLIRLAASADRIAFRQSKGGAWVPEGLVDQLMLALRMLPCLAGPASAKVALQRREVRRCVVDSRARIRIRYARHILAGVVAERIEGKDQQILVLALVGSGIRSCDWQLDS